MKSKKLIKIKINHNEEKYNLYHFVENESELAELEAEHAKKQEAELYSYGSYRYDLIELDIEHVEMQELEGLKLVDFARLLKLVEKHEWMK